MQTDIEFASSDRGLGGPYRSLAERTGRPLREIVELAQQDRLGELFGSNGRLLVEKRSHATPLSGRDALRRIEGLRYAPGTKPRSPAALLGELRARKACWAIEAEEAQRQRDPYWRLGDILAKQRSPWLED